MENIFKDLKGTEETGNVLTQFKKLDFGGNNSKFDYKRQLSGDDYRDLKIDENYKKSRKKKANCPTF